MFTYVNNPDSFTCTGGSVVVVGSAFILRNERKDLDLTAKIVDHRLEDGRLL